ncbi:MAG: STAS domain-containing protein [Gemmataceae bacterium]
MAAAGDDGLEWEDVGDVTVVRVKMAMLWGDPATDTLFTSLHRLIDDPARHKFALDVGGIQYFASAALGKLVALHRKAQAAQARLVLVNVTGPVARILQVTHLDELMLTYASEREAIRALA